MDEELLTTGEAAALLGSSRQHVVDLCERGHLVYVRIDTHRRLRRTDVEVLAKRTLNRDQARSLWLHRVVAGRLAMHPEETVAKARANIETLRRVHPSGAARRWIEQWQMLLDGPVDPVSDILASPTEWAVELRQNSPFAGVLSEQERQRSSPSNEASPQPDEACRGRLAGRGLRSGGVETVTGGPVRCMNRSKRLVGLLAARPTGCPFTCVTNAEGSLM